MRRLTLSAPDMLMRGVAIPNELCRQTAVVTGLESDANSGFAMRQTLHATRLARIPPRIQILGFWSTRWRRTSLSSFSLIRIVRPYVQILAQHHWAAFALLVCALFAVLPTASKIVDYGAEGWLWALFGLYQRVYVDGRSASDVSGASSSSASARHAMTENGAILRLLACFVAAAVVYIWQEQREFSFPKIHFAVFILGVGVLSTGPCLFLRGPSRIQPPEVIAGALRFIRSAQFWKSRNPACRLELLVKLVPDLAP